jgi:death-on-curing family protein
VPGEVRFLSVEQVLRIHEEMLRRYGGSRIPGHRGEVEGVTAAVMAVINSYYSDVLDLAAAYAVYIVMGHVFGDGNKRTASGAALTFLHVNGVLVAPAPGELRDLLIELQLRAERDPRPPTQALVAFVAGWLRDHIVNR